MRFIASIAFLCALGAAYAAPGSNGLPPEVHPSFAAALDKADAAIAKRDFQYALALCHGILYSNGIKIQLAEPTLGNQKNDMYRATQSAIKAWESALGRDCPLKLVAATPADVKVQIVERIPEAGDDALGLIQMRHQYRWTRSDYSVTTTATVHVQRSYDGAAMSSGEYTEIVCHELGHLLGLADVDQRGLLMGPMVIGKVILAPAPYEAQVVQTLRSKARAKVAEIERMKASVPVSLLDVCDVRTKLQHLQQGC